MIRHNLILIYRNFRRFKSTFFINLIGLSTGLACTLLIYLWVKDELSVDKFHKNDRQLYTVMSNFHNSDNIITNQVTSGLLGEALFKEVAGIEYAVSVSDGTQTFLLSHGELHLKEKGLFASKDFFKAFSYELIEGDPDKVLSDRNSIVISESLAKKLFNNTASAIGKALQWEILIFKREVTVTGVFKDVPANSSDQFDFVLTFDVFEKDVISYPQWNNNYAITSLVLKDGVDPESFTEKISGFMKTKDTGSNVTLFLQRYSERYLHGTYENGFVTGGRITYVILFTIIAVFILMIACINFMNLSTAKATRRIKEVGIKKAVGAHRSTLIIQYISESMIMSFSSLIIAVLIVDLLLPQFNIITGKALVLTFDPYVILSFTAIAFVTGVVSGSYPALYLSGFNPATVLKGKLSTSFGELLARKGLVIFQFVISIILIVSVLVVYKQIQFVQNKNLGYSKDNILYFVKEGKINSSPETFINEAKKIPGIINATLANYHVGGEGWTYGIEWEGKKPDDLIQFHEVNVGHDIIEMFDIDIVDGRSFSRDFPSDSVGIIFNEAAIRVMGLKDPVGKTVRHYQGEKKIVGIMKDFHFASLYSQVQPMCFIFNPEDTNYIITKVEAGREKDAIEKLTVLYNTFNPGYAFEYKFMDDDYQALYAAELRVAQLSKYFAGLAILISCLGLFGLAAFTAERRLKEIGIRKVLGSSEFGIIYLLSIDFTKIVVLANVIALPLSYLVAIYWLGDFAFKIRLEWWYFIGAGMVALMIAWITVGSQALKASRINPARYLKDE